MVQQESLCSPYEYFSSSPSSKLGNHSDVIPDISSLPHGYSAAALAAAAALAGGGGCGGGATNGGSFNGNGTSSSSSSSVNVPPTSGYPFSTYYQECGYNKEDSTSPQNSNGSAA
jgi:hypothetical protein